MTIKWRKTLQPCNVNILTEENGGCRVQPISQKQPQKISDNDYLVRTVVITNPQHLYNAYHMSVA